MAGVHPLAKSAFSVSGGSGLYDRARPSYPPDAISQIIKVLPSAASVVELGSGTGIFTRAFLDALADARTANVSKWTAVEPAEGMRQGFKEKVIDARGGKDKITLACVPGSFDSIPVADASANLVVAAQAFHWVGRDQSFQEAAMASPLQHTKIFASHSLTRTISETSLASWSPAVTLLLFGTSRTVAQQHGLRS